jgi:hypothetical protein
MTLVDIPQEKVSEQLDGDDGTLTVPDGEIWRVNMSFGARDRDDKMVTARINGTPIMSIGGQDRGDYQSHGTTTCDMVLVGGDSLNVRTQDANGDDGGFHLGGYKVQSNE